MGYRPVSRMDALLYELCAKYGWCPGSDATRDLLGMPAENAEAVADAIIRAEFGADRGCDAQTRDWLVGLVDDWLFSPSGRGVSSGLPG